MKEERKHFVFSGRVQGVGFRYSAYYLARLLELTGWVRNEYDGTVTMEVQGRPEQIDRLLQKLQSDRLIRIDHISATNLPLQAERTFCVR
ncbi:MAG: acylphosphatase [Hespellia sp.]|nr:acylphosphatase [Hespellia sp.]